ncbi:MAG: SUMF1/EgtB/PvdO family nonheme iron enzyme [Gammaproteobacteria bacterium]
MYPVKMIGLLTVFNLLVLTACSSDKSTAPADDVRSLNEICFDGGELVMGSDHHYPEEGPSRVVQVKPFCLDTNEVKVADFEKFVNATGYRTVAETGPDPKDYPGQPPEYFQPGGSVFVFPTVTSPGYWSFNAQANWRQPFGIAQSIVEAEEHPVTQIAFKDAHSFASWLGRRLPTEAEWEFAAKRGGLSIDQVSADNGDIANIWNGEFPLFNSKNDGYEGTAPVGSYAADANGIFDMLGNVWEWTADSYDKQKSSDGRQYVIKGGSHLCATNFCARFRPEARQPQDSGLGSSHIGFRTARSR